MTQWDGDTALAPTPVISGFSASGGEFAGYACGKCHKIVAVTAQELQGYLQSRGMIRSEYRSID